MSWFVFNVMVQLAGVGFTAIYCHFVDNSVDWGGLGPTYVCQQGLDPQHETYIGRTRASETYVFDIR